MPVHRLSRNARDGPLRAIYRGPPANDEVLYMVWFKARICVTNTEHVKHHAHRLSTDGNFEAKHILRLITRCATSVDRAD